ncbi:MAG: Rne/Rng family ribonuclease [Bosea sp. (in: a-proteobacteria)]
MANKMLIDASHPEETRVVVVRGQKVEEFDFESASRRPLRGNIYLAKVTRVEPSLQAAFVEYGGNRHGFLAFSEIHPDYYQIPTADRQALLAEQARYEEDADGDAEPRERKSERDGERGGSRDGGRGRGRRRRGGRDGSREKRADSDATVSAPVDEEGNPTAVDDANANGEMADHSAHAVDDNGSEAGNNDDAAHDDIRHEDNGRDESSRDDNGEDDKSDEARKPAEPDDDGEYDDGPRDERPAPEQLGGDDAMDDVQERPRFQSRRQYKIQEVIKRRQILLVQVVKEERGNKGAALTTFLSLAGRYSVLMPNTGRGGGISRKITSAEDRKRLKEIAGELEVPDGMGIILRTAGASRTKPEIKRDYEYLMRMWESVRELTLSSSAPALVYEEGSLIKRAIRDLYNKDIDDISVAGEAGYREAKDFMKMLMPSHAKSVRAYREQQPLFAKFGVESQLDAMFSSQVTLKSGGYIVINQTEALVSIDVNSGRSTREHNIEDTALKTNLEASEEVARQLRLRDLAGLIVIDFIDMEEKRNNRHVEKRLKDCLKNDRARIQVGHISSFGLMEMSRQRIRTGVLESSSVKCAHCDGTGFVRSTPSVALQILRAVEESLIRVSTHSLIVKTRTEVAIYVLNQKRAHLTALETQFGVGVTLDIDNTLMGSTYYSLERGEFVQAEPLVRVSSMVAEEIEDEDEDDVADVEADITEEEDEAAEAAPRDRENETDEERERNDTEEAGRSRRRRRRRRGRGGDRERNGERELGADRQSGGSVAGNDNADGDAGEAAGETDVEASASEKAADGDDRGSGGGRLGRRRGRRGGRRTRGETGSEESTADEAADAATDDTPVVADAPIVSEPITAAAPEPEIVEVPAEKPKRGRKKKVVEEVVAADVELAEVEVKAKTKTRARKTDIDEPVAEPPAPAPEPEPVVPEPEPVAVVLSEIDPNRPKRGGWWAKK